MKAIIDHDSWESLNEYLTSLTTSDKSSLAGIIFENVSKYYLQTAPHYKTKFKNVWLLKEVSNKIRSKLNLPNTDEGIDLIVETIENKYWAIQCKYRSNVNSTLTVKGDLSTFSNLAFNFCKNIEHGLVLTTSNKPPLKSKFLKNIGFDTLESFLSLDDNNFEGWKAIKAKSEGKNFKPEAKKPRPHQIEAIQKSINHFVNNDRGKILMPCGTGKSLASFWIARSLNAKSIIVAVPSLSLLQQTLKVWTREFLINNVEPDWLCVCSHNSVSQNIDEFFTNTSEMGFHITSDAYEVHDWLKKRSIEIKIVFTTYQSAHITAKGSKNFNFDLAILDEAHKTVGNKNKKKAVLLDEKAILIKKRLFMTATERLFNPYKDKEDYLSMDNAEDYGTTIFQLSVKKAIEANPQIISDYKVITCSVKEGKIEEVYKSNKFLKIKNEINENITAREFATAIALRKSIKKYGLKNSLSFHSSIERANNFKKQQDYISKIYPEYGLLNSFHVNGKMQTGKRASEMRSFAKSRKSLMTNARCLTEGVDLPSIDCVIFTDPKKSKIDIVQAAGRALRTSPGKKFGYILIPIFVSKDEDPKSSTQGTAYEEILNVIGFLSTQDARISEHLSSVSEGKIPNRGSPVENIIVQNELTQVDPVEFNKAIAIKLWDKISRINIRSFKEHVKYARSLSIQGESDWDKEIKKKNFPKDLYKNTRRVFLKTKEWRGWNYFTGFTPLTFEDAKQLARENNIKNLDQWYKFAKSKEVPKNCPISITDAYPGFKGTKDFFGTIFCTYDEAKKILARYNFKKSDDFMKFKRTNEFKKLNIPAAPQAYYKREFKSYSDFLNFVKKESYEEARKFAHTLNLKKMSEWVKYSFKPDFPKNLPKHPREYYKNSGWIDAYDFLGVEKEFLSYDKAKIFAHKLKLKHAIKWTETIRKMKNFPSNIPKAPKSYYELKNKGWLGWSDFLGSTYLGGTQKEQRVENTYDKKIKIRIKDEDSRRFINKEFKLTFKQIKFAKILLENEYVILNYFKEGERFYSKNENKKGIRKLMAIKAGYITRPTQSASQNMNIKKYRNFADYFYTLMKSHKLGDN